MSRRECTTQAEVNAAAEAGGTVNADDERKADMELHLAGLWCYAALCGLIAGGELSPHQSEIATKARDRYRAAQDARYGPGWRETV